MSKLTSKERNALPNSAFAGPGRSYPVNDKVHAEKAIQLSARGVAAGNISEEQRDAIVRRAKTRLKDVR